MIYLHAFAIHNSLPKSEPPDLKTEFRVLSGTGYRRIDRFIQLALIGAHKAASGHKLSPDTAVYLVSGQGDIPVFNRVRRQRYFQQMMSKPVDFVNLSSNTAGFYVASHLGLKGSNLFLAHHNFPAAMALLLAQTKLVLKQESAILIGGVDEWPPNQILGKKLLGVDDSLALGEGSNWMLLSGEAAEALAAIKVSPETFDLEGLQKRLAMTSPGTRLAFSKRFPADLADRIINGRALKRFRYEAGCAYYETLPFYALNCFLQAKDGEKLLFLDCDISGKSYMLLWLSLLPA